MNFDKEKILSDLECSGYSIQKVENASDRVNANLYNLGNLLGDPLANKHSKSEYVADITANPTFYTDGIMRPVSDTGTQSPHCDGGYKEYQPDFVILHSHQKAEIGGRTTTINGRKMYDFIRKEHSQLLNQLLTEDFYLVARGSDRVIRPVFDKINDTQIELCWADHEYMTSQNMEINPNCLESFAILQKYVRDTRNQLLLDIQEGESVIFDNRQALHGRESFSDIDDYRWYKRLWIKSNLTDYKTGFTVV